jgi:hypothetical protein
MGDYRGAIAHIQEALGLASPGTDDSAKKDKLYSRMAKSFLHLSDLKAAEGAISSISSEQLRADLGQSVESIKSAWVEAPEESVLRRQVLDQIPYYRPWMYVVPQSHHVVRSLIKNAGKMFQNIMPWAMTRSAL